MLKILIADDEPIARERLCQFVASFPGYTIIGEAENGTQAIKKTIQLQPDIVVIDMRMPDIDGITAAERIHQLDNPPAIIFSTAYDEYALEAFSTNAIDYVLKPVNKDRFQKALEKVTHVNKALQTHMQSLKKLQSPTIKVRHGKTIEYVPIEDIIYCLADDKYTKIFYGESHHLVEESLKALERAYPEYFIRIHRNAIVTKKMVRAIEQTNKGKYNALLSNDTRLEISRRHLANLRAMMKAASHSQPKESK